MLQLQYLFNVSSICGHQSLAPTLGGLAGLDDLCGTDPEPLILAAGLEAVEVVVVIVVGRADLSLHFFSKEVVHVVHIGRVKGQVWGARSRR